MRLDVMDAANRFVTTVVDNVTQSNEAEHEVFNACMEDLEAQMDRLLHQIKHSDVGRSTSVPTPLDSVTSMIPQKKLPKLKTVMGQDESVVSIVSTLQNVLKMATIRDGRQWQ